MTAFRINLSPNRKPRLIVCTTNIGQMNESAAVADIVNRTDLDNASVTKDLDMLICVNTVSSNLSVSNYPM